MDAFLAVLTELLDFVPEVVEAATLIVVVVEIVKRLGFVSNGWHRVLALVLNAAIWVGCYIAREKGVEADFLAVVENVGSLAETLLPFVLTVIGSNLFYKVAKKWGLAASRDWLDKQKAQGKK